MDFIFKNFPFLNDEHTCTKLSKDAKETQFHA